MSGFQMPKEALAGQWPLGSQTMWRTPVDQNGLKWVQMELWGSRASTDALCNESNEPSSNLQPNLKQ